MTTNAKNVRNFQLWQSGTLTTGCNYWASHAGLFMWSDWRPEVVDQDFQRLAGARMKVLRVFPLWSDFQKITMLRGVFGQEVQLCPGGEELSADIVGPAGLVPEMIARFRLLAELAEKYQFQLIVGLLTGWMSGRLFVPAALENVKLISDPLAVRLEVEFVRAFIDATKDCPAIVAWEPGNECNCLEKVGQSQAWSWTHSIVSAIRLADPSRAVLSGMHSLSIGGGAPWQIPDQAELTDLLTTHPYPLFTAHCNTAPYNEMPSSLHAVAESRFYGDLGGKPCCVEEAGSLGPMIASEERAAAHLRSALWGAWAHDLRLFLWWCAFDLDSCEKAPYDWTALERRLGLFTSDRTPKAMAHVIRDFVERLEAAGIKELPVRQIDAVCLLSCGQESVWHTAFGAFQLAVQSGISLRFAWAQDPLPEADCYILPGISSSTAISRHRYLKLLEKVEQGAALLVTDNNGMLEPFEPVTGCRVDFRCRIPGTVTFRCGEEQFSGTSPMTQRILPGDCEILGCDAAGDAIFTCHNHGKGAVFYLGIAPELQSDLGRSNWYRIYRIFRERCKRELFWPEKPPEIGMTRHVGRDGTISAVAVNYSGKDVICELGKLAPRRIFPSEALLGGKLKIPGNDAVILEF
ncbi:MAG: hypothetical protein PHS41_08535 [Victivallaceae bacterium]|nr:hypothetical protein [Victivallaceae bacterium]